MPPKITKNPKNQRGKKRKKNTPPVESDNDSSSTEVETGKGEPDDAADTEEDNMRLTKSAVHGEYVQTSETAISDLVDKGYIFVLPERDQHGRRVIFSQAAAFDSSKYTVNDLMRTHVMTFVIRNPAQ